MSKRTLTVAIGLMIMGALLTEIFQVREIAYYTAAVIFGVAVGVVIRD